MDKRVKFAFEPAEDFARMRLTTDQPLLIEGIRVATDLLFETLDAFSSRLKQSTQLTQVVAQLILKVFDDFRCVSLLGLSGYPTQAAGLVASLYESVVTLCYVGDDPDMAKEWAQHGDATRLFRSIKEITRVGLGNIFDQVSSDLVEKEYADYRQLCMAKHGNPIYIKTQGFVKKGTEVTLIVGPKSLDSSYHVIRFAVGKSIMYIAWACSAIGKFHIEDKDTERILVGRNNAMGIVERIVEEIKKEGYVT